VCVCVCMCVFVYEYMCKTVSAISSNSITCMWFYQAIAEDSQKSTCTHVHEVWDPLCPGMLIWYVKIRYSLPYQIRQVMTLYPLTFWLHVVVWDWEAIV